LDEHTGAHCKLLNWGRSQAKSYLFQGILTEPDEGQLLRGIHSTDVPQRLEWLVKALVHESDAEEKGR
jgi:hypothetical protein